MTKQEKAKEVLDRLSKLFPNPKTSLDHANAFELLVATILSAQATDVLVNKVTPELFKKYPDAKAMSNASIEEIDATINKVNFHNNKAKNIKNMSQILVDKYNGEVPSEMDKLIELPGVARKTANVVMGSIWGKAEGVVVDTHVMRLSQKLGLSEKKDAVKIEKDLMEIVPKDKWIDFSLLLILYGRQYCPARKHNESKCPLVDLYTIE